MGPSVIVTSSKELDLREQHGVLLKSSSGIMPDACVVFGCSRTADPQRGIGLHRIPIFDDSREEMGELCPAEESLIGANHFYSVRA